jgi:hypothetical protein
MNQYGTTDKAFRKLLSELIGHNFVAEYHIDIGSGASVISAVKELSVDSKSLDRVVIILFVNSIHVNILLVNNGTRSILHYEPHGGSYKLDSDRELNDKLYSTTRDLCHSLFPEYQYIPPYTVMGSRIKKGNQRDISRQSPYAGSCVLWCCWCAEEYVKNCKIPEAMEPAKLVKYLYRKYLKVLEMQS